MKILKRTTECIIIMLTLILIMSVGAFAVGADVFEKCETAKKGEIVLKKKPDSNSETLSVIENGQSVFRIVRDAAKKNGVKWDKVLLDDGTVGYIASDRLKQSSSAGKISIKKTSIKIGLNEEIRLKAFFNETVEGELKLYISDASVISVDENYVIKGLSVGKAVLGFYTEEKYALLKIEVCPAPTGITLNEEYIELKKGETFDLNSYCHGGQSYSRPFTSSNEAVLTVTSKGIVTALKNGTATVTVKTYNGKTAKCKIKVCDYPVKIKITNTNNVIQKGADNHLVTYKLTNGSSVKKIYFSVEDTSVATVNENGYVKGLKKGKTTLTVKTDKGVKASVKITVQNDSMRLNCNSTQIALDFDNVEKVKYGKSYQDRNLEAFIITNPKKTTYKKTLFMDFAIHGFEDEYYRDGKVLVSEAHAIIDYFAKNPSYLGDYRLMIVPCANPDGTVAGENNLRKGKTAFGRCTANHVDMNRDFGSFKAVETVALKNLIVSSKPDVYLNFHGWYDEVIGDKALAKIIAKKMYLSDVDNHYGSTEGYAIGWVHDNLKIPVALVEYASSNEVYLSRDVDMIKAIIKNY